MEELLDLILIDDQLV